MSSSLGCRRRRSKDRIIDGFRWTGFLCLLVVILPVSVAAANHPIYVKRDSLWKTMLDTRIRLQEWQAAQRKTRMMIHVDRWQWITLKTTGALDPLRFTQEPVNADAGESIEGIQKNSCPMDATGNPSPPTASFSSADYLYATITAGGPTQLTIELSRHEAYGGFAYRPSASGAGTQVSDALIWVNGQPLPVENRLAGFANVPVAKRRGWHEGVMIDVPLKQGKNQVLVSLHKGQRQHWFNSVRIVSNPIPALWAMIEHDFPRSRNHLLARVDHAWFDAEQGWFSAGQACEFERRLITQILAQLGTDGMVLQQRCSQLFAADEAVSADQWLKSCITVCEFEAAEKQIESLRAAINALAKCYASVDGYSGQEGLGRIDDLWQRVEECAGEGLDPAEQRTQQLWKEIKSLKYQSLVVQNPLLADKQLLFVKRKTYDSDHYYDEHCHGTREFGGGLFTLSMRDGKVAEVSPRLSDGLVDRYDLSSDGQRILFGYKPPEPEGFRVYEIGVDGTGFRQVTFPPADEAERIATYSMVPTRALKQNPGGYGHWTDDMHPCYLPDGRIVFTSTRSERSVLCGGHSLTVANLYRINSDGTDLQQLSQGALSEFCPTVMNDGRVLYNRWEYVDKGAGAVQSLWAMNPDGSRSEEIYGNNITTPGVFNQARNVPGQDHLVVCLGAGHCPGNIGAILLVDLHKNRRTEEAMTALTPDCIPKGNWALRQFRNGRWMTDIHGPWYCDPFPLADRANPAVAGKFFLVSCNPQGMWNDSAGYGIYLLDVFGNRVPIYDDSEFSCFQAMILQSRPAPPVLPDVKSSEKLARDVEENGQHDVQVARQDCGPLAAAWSDPATVLVTDIYQGLEGVPRGTIKYIRVMEQVPRPWSVYQDYSPGDRAPGQMVAISLYTHLSVKVVHGIVPVHEDGSAYFQVPADRNIFFQALDENFMEVQRMRTFVDFQPGERRSCIGCHELRNQVPRNQRPMALAALPVQPQPQPGEEAPRPLHYPTDVQPIFDRHCVSCHGQDNPDGDLDLTSEMTSLFCRSYENIINKQLVPYVQEFIGPKPEAADAMGYAPAVPPYTYSSHRSELVRVLLDGHYDVRLSREEFVRLVTWVDANAPYYGSYFGRRNRADFPGQDARPRPTLASALGIRPEPPPVSQPVRASKPTELLAWWKLDHVRDRQLDDASGHASAARLIGSGSVVDGRIGNAIQLDGQGCIRASVDGRLKALSLAFWMRPESEPTELVSLFQTDGWQAFGFHMQLFQQGTVSYAVHGNEPLRLGSRTKIGYQLGQWHHLAVVYDANDRIAELYVNGQLESAATLSTAKPVALDGFCIGSWNEGGRFFHGSVDDLRIYRGPLSPADVVQLSNAH